MAKWPVDLASPTIRTVPRPGDCEPTRCPEWLTRYFAGPRLLDAERRLINELFDRRNRPVLSLQVGFTSGPTSLSMTVTIKRIAKRLLPRSTRTRVRRWLSSRAQSPRVPEPASTRPGDTAPGDPSVRGLEDRLWLGYETSARDGLSLIATRGARPSDRIQALQALGRWEMAQNRFDAALEHLDRVATGASGPGPDVTALSLASDCLSRLGRGRQALARLSPLLDRRDPDASTLIRMGTARSIAQGPSDHGSGPFIEALNRLYIPAQLACLIRKEVTSPAGVANLSAFAPIHEPRESEPLISVIVPSSNTSDPIEAAIQSLMAQSWRNLEVLVVGGSNADETTAVVRSLMAIDPRVKMVESSSPDRPYSDRYAGLCAASGTLITVHGSKEWSHPQRLEIQAGALAADPSLLAVGTHHIKVGSDFTHRPLDHRPTVPLVGRNSTSLLFRRALLEKVGLWDEVQGPIDDEFAERVEAGLGPGAIAWVEPGLPLSLVLDPIEWHSDQVLDFRSREAHFHYRDAFRWWHTSPGFRSTLPYRPDAGPRPFPLPQALLSGQTAEQNTGLLVVGHLDGDWAPLLLRLLEHHSGETGLIHVPAFKEKSLGIAPAFHSLMAAGRATILPADSIVRCRTLLVGPSLLDSPRFDHLPKVTTDRAVLLRGHADNEADVGTEIAELEDWAGTSLRVMDINDPALAGIPPWE